MMQIPKIIRLTLFFFLIGTSITFDAYSSELASELENIKTQIKKGHEEADYKILLQAHQAFNKLNPSNKELEAIIDQLKIHKWPQQNLQEAVGGHIFYPPNVNDLWDYSYLNHFFQRTDTIWGLAISAKYKNPLACYYLAWSLDNIGDEVKYGSRGRLPFISNLYNQSFKILEESYQDSPEACYILGINHADYSWKIGVKDLNIKKALNYHKAAKDPRNKLELLNMNTISYKEDPKATDYTTLAKTENYIPAYLAFSRFQVDNQQIIDYLTQEGDTNSPYVLIEIGNTYEAMGNKQKAFEYYQKVSDLSDSSHEKNHSQEVIATGYLKMAGTILGDLVLDKKSREDLGDIKTENLNKARGYLEAAANLNDPQACEQLIVLYKTLYEFEGKDSYIDQLKIFLEKGMKLGLASAYRKVYKFFPQEYKSLVQNYGSYPEGDLIQNIESFLSSQCMVIIF